MLEEEEENARQRHPSQKEGEAEQCLRWVRDQLRALRHTNRIYEQRVIGRMETSAGASAGASI